MSELKKRKYSELSKNNNLNELKDNTISNLNELKDTLIKIKYMNIRINRSIDTLLIEIDKLKNKNCNHNWVVDYDACWDQGGPTPRICSKCKLT
tara:strand:+ start:239 stop:520 length:282 start_codon:yes stop_codon:yes gene_type:complete